MNTELLEALELLEKEKDISKETKIGRASCRERV